LTTFFRGGIGLKNFNLIVQALHKIKKGKEVKTLGGTVVVNFASGIWHHACVPNAVLRRAGTKHDSQDTKNLRRRKRDEKVYCLKFIWAADHGF
jgi:hypothetical protein